MTESADEIGPVIPAPGAGAPREVAPGPAAPLRIPGRAERRLPGRRGSAPLEMQALALGPEAGLDALMPGAAGGLVLPLVLAVLRPDARRWLGPERLARLAASLGLKEAALAALLDAVPQPHAALGEPSLWTGRRAPLLAPDGTTAWLDLLWRPDRGRRARPRDRGVFALRITLPAAGRIELRGRLEENRLDAVMETALPLPKPVAADVVEAFEAVLLRLGLEGSLTVRHTGGEHRT